MVIEWKDNDDTCDIFNKISQVQTGQIGSFNKELSDREVSEEVPKEEKTVATLAVFSFLH